MTTSQGNGYGTQSMVQGYMKLVFQKLKNIKRVLCIVASGSGMVYRSMRETLSHI